ncbi:MAG: cyclic pyranopterin monophosphate synthase MoaC [Clostridiales bacterium]|nr:cyclic pyranopterin monophosphate synthase MoaC [Clostridiales bacterium]
MENILTHFDQNGKASMVDVSEKEITTRAAVAVGRIKVNLAAFNAIRSGKSEKGDVLETARVAGNIAAKRTPDLIPLCHRLELSQVKIDFMLHYDGLAVEVKCTVKLCGKTGAEMEALTGATAALLTIYDMCKALDRNMRISDIYLLDKEGGKSGQYHYTENSCSD